MSSMRISVVMPCLNQVDYLERALCSVLDQGYANLELIVADGGSDDGGAEILELYRKDIAELIVRPGTNPAEALNRGIARATGEVIGIVPAHDLCLPGTLQRVAARMRRMDQPQWLVGKCLRINGRDQMQGALEPGDPKSLASFLMHDTGPLPTTATYFRKSLWSEYGGFDASYQFAYDYEFWCRLLAEGHRPTLLAQPLAAARDDAETRPALATIQQGLEYIRVARCFIPRLPVAQRYALWRNCDQRERIYALAQAEMRGQEARQFIWQQLVRHPWWLANTSIRHAILHQTAPAAPTPLRRAA